MYLGEVNKCCWSLSEYPVISWESYWPFTLFGILTEATKSVFMTKGKGDHTQLAFSYILCLVWKVPVITLISSNLFWWLAKQTNKKLQTLIPQLKFHVSLRQSERSYYPVCVIFIIALFLFGWQISLFHGAEVKNHLELNERSFAYFCVFFWVPTNSISGLGLSYKNPWKRHDFASQEFKSFFFYSNVTVLKYTTKFQKCYGK